MLERRIHVRCALLRGERAEEQSGATDVRLRTRTAAVLDEQFRESLCGSPDSFVFGHPALGTPADPSKLSGYMRKAMNKARIERPFPTWHGLRHTRLTHDAVAGNPAVHVHGPARHAMRRRRKGASTPPRSRSRAPPTAPSRGSSALFRREAPVESPAEKERARRGALFVCSISSDFQAPRAGLEPATLRLTAGCSAN
jgi:hypothetical protein